VSKVEDYHKKMFRVIWEDTEDRSTLCEDCLDMWLIKNPNQIIDYFEDKESKRFGEIVECDVCGFESPTDEDEEN
jgi:hypothetical protein